MRQIIEQLAANLHKYRLDCLPAFRCGLSLVQALDKRSGRGPVIAEIGVGGVDRIGNLDNDAIVPRLTASAYLDMVVVIPLMQDVVNPAGRLDKIPFPKGPGLSRQQLRIVIFLLLPRRHNGHFQFQKSAELDLPRLVGENVITRLDGPPLVDNLRRTRNRTGEEKEEKEGDLLHVKQMS